MSSTWFERLTLDAPPTEHNRDYLDTKRRFFGHMPARDPATAYLAPHAFAQLFDGRASATNGSGPPQGGWAIEIAIASYWTIRDASPRG